MINITVFLVFAEKRLRLYVSKKCKTVVFLSNMHIVSNELADDREKKY